MIYRTTPYDPYNSRINLILSKLRTFERKKLSGRILENCAEKFYIPFRRRRSEGCRDLFVTRIVETYKYVYKELEFFLPFSDGKYINLSRIFVSSRAKVKEL